MELLNSYETMQPDNQLFYAFLEAALWSTPCSDESLGDEYLDELYSFEEIDQESANKVKAFCLQFAEAAGVDALLENNYSQAGHDLFLTISGAGCGFWDGEWQENGARLTHLCDDLVKHIEVYDSEGTVFIDLKLAEEDKTL